MGFTLFIYPKEVFKGYKAGLNTIGIIDLKIAKEALLKMSVSDLKERIKKDQIQPLNWFQFLFWVFTSAFIFIFPLLILVVLGIVFY